MSVTCWQDNLKRHIEHSKVSDTMSEVQQIVSNRWHMATEKCHCNCLWYFTFKQMIPLTHVTNVSIFSSLLCSIQLSCVQWLFEEPRAVRVIKCSSLSVRLTQCTGGEQCGHANCTFCLFLFLSLSLQAATSPCSTCHMYRYFVRFFSLHSLIHRHQRVTGFLILLLFFPSPTHSITSNLFDCLRRREDDEAKLQTYHRSELAEKSFTSSRL